jgi:hypothetical protein
VIRIESTDADGLPRNGLASTLVLTSSTGVSQSVPLQQEAPGVYAGVASSVTEGVYEARITQVDPGSELVVAAQQTGIVVPYSPEYALREGGEEDARLLLHTITQLTGARQLDSTRPLDALAPARFDQPRRIQLWPWLLVAALLLFPIDVAIRRLTVSWRELFKVRRA